MRPPRIPSQFSRNFNFLKREKSTISILITIVMNLTRSTHLRWVVRFFFHSLRLASLEKQRYRTNATVILFSMSDALRRGQNNEVFFSQLFWLLKERFKHEAKKMFYLSVREKPYWCQ